MAENVVLGNLANLQNETTAVNTINNNNSLITSAFSDVLSRSGVSPNQMMTNLDMNSNSIINLAPPITINSPARLVDVVTNPTVVVPPTGTSGAVVGFLNANKTDSGTNNYSATQTFTNIVVNGTSQFNSTNTFSSTTTFNGGVFMTNGLTLNTSAAFNGIVNFNSTATFNSNPNALSSTSAFPQFYFTNFTNDGFGPYVIFQKERNAIGNSASNVTNGDIMGNVLWQGYTGGTGGGMANACVIAGQVSGTPTSTYAPSRILFQTSTNAQLDSNLFIQAGGIQGVTTNSNAFAGNVGEFVQSTVLQGTPVSASNGTAITITSISLTPGDWDVYGAVYAIPASSTTMTQLQGSISTVNNTASTVAGTFFSFNTNSVTTGAVPTGYAIPVVRTSIGSTTTLYLVGQCNFGTSTCSLFGYIAARRMR